MEEEMKSEYTSSEVHDAIKDLLGLCESKNVEVPSDLRKLLDGIVDLTATSSGRGQSGSQCAVSFQDKLVSDHAHVVAQKSDSPFVRQIAELLEKLKVNQYETSIKVKDGSFTVTQYFDESHADAKRKPKIATVYTTGPFGILTEKLKRIWRTKSLCQKMSVREKHVMKGINLSLQAGKMYLVLGAPQCGKSTLLKMIAGILPENRDNKLGGEVSLNNFSSKSDDVVWSNLVGYINQIDRLHPFLTVKETCDFAWRCRSGRTHRTPLLGEGPAIDEEIAHIDEIMLAVALTLEGLGLKRVPDTFVGDQQTVRGVSGGEKKRVTVGEMFVGGYPALCMDEISTGLDAATTYDICKLIGEVSGLQKRLRIVSLLQPPPETFALFDELILLSEGQIIYSGPTQKVVPYFESLGFSLPDRMDVADWLQALPTSDGSKFLRDDAKKLVLTSEQFSQIFYESELGKGILEKVGEETKIQAAETKDYIRYIGEKYRNSHLAALKLLVQREMLLWWRDKTQIRARLAQDLVMGIIAGTLFWQENEDPTSVMGILFQSMFFVSVGAFLKVIPQYEVRGILYKQQDANFYPTWTYVVGKSLATIPASIIDAVVYGNVVFWFVGLAHNDGAGIGNYFMFMALILIASVVIGLQFSIFPAITKDKSTGQACMSVAVLLFVLFSGYTVQPNVIPKYWLWMYWFNTFSWALRGLAVNEFDSGKYDAISSTTGLTEGAEILTRFGFTDGDGNAYTIEWAWWSIVYSLSLCLVAVMVSSVCLVLVRFETGKSLGGDDNDDADAYDDDGGVAESDEVVLPFQKVDLTFKDIHYSVISSVGNETLELLKGVDGVVEAGKMTALMGSSGAGKTTLMDVLAMRKTSGEIEGEIRLNGYPQEENSFRRCTGYVEQFDTQSAQLTIRETCMFSAKLRLESASDQVTPESTAKFVEQTLRMLELSKIADLQVGNDELGGLSFEQRKRLSIAVELVSNPSIIFLDEPTSGLDARAAAIVMRGLKRIASSGRAVCATIHQPSIAIFNSFDSLLLLKRGGETIFFGSLGDESQNLIQYLERYEATPRIQPGENPATWMLTTIGAGSAATDVRPFDYAGHYRVSQLHKDCVKRINEIISNITEKGKVSFPSVYATPTATQIREVMARTRLVYWRSPSYNTVRTSVAAILSFLIGSVYVSNRVPTDESDMNSRTTTIFMAYLFIAMNSLNTVLNVFELERNMYYRHKASLMYDNKAILLAFTVAEVPFIIVSSFIYVSIFYFMIGLTADASKFFMFWFFMFLNMANFTFLGQMFVSLTRDAVAAQGFGGLLVSMTSLFTGTLIRPANMPSFWLFMYWLMPGHYIFEGLLVSQYDNDLTPIAASPNTLFWQYLRCDEQPSPCVGTAEQWVFASFSGFFIPEHIPWNILYLIGVLLISRTTTGFALAYLNYRQT